MKAPPAPEPSGYGVGTRDAAHAGLEAVADRDLARRVEASGEVHAADDATKERIARADDAIFVGGSLVKSAAFVEAAPDLEDQESLLAPAEVGAAWRR
jgi:hypothetical protein